MGILIFIIVLLIVVVVVIKIFELKQPLNKEKKESIYKYTRKDFLMSRSEHEFYNILVEQFGYQYFIFPQIHLSTILDNKVQGQNWRGAFRHIDEKSVDFVICDKAYIKPLLAIELDDKTHERNDRKDRDEEVERILNDAGLQLLRFSNHGNFNKEEIKKLVLENLNK